MILMIDGEHPATGEDPDRPGLAPGKPRRDWLVRILERGPEARQRLVRAVAPLLGTVLIALAAIGGLMIWHLIRRGRLIRQRLGPPRVVRLPQLTDDKVDPNDQRKGDPPPA